MRPVRLGKIRGYLEVQSKKMEMRAAIAVNFEGKNIEVFAYCKGRIFYRVRDAYTKRHIKTDRYM